MFELFKLLEASASCTNVIVVKESINFTFNQKKITVQETDADMYDVFENDCFVETMTRKDFISKYKI